MESPSLVISSVSHRHTFSLLAWNNVRQLLCKKWQRREMIEVVSRKWGGCGVWC